MNVDQIINGFWHQWDIKVLNFQVVSVLNIAAVVFLAATAELFDFNKLVNLGSWEISDLYIFLGPIIAQAFSLLVVDSATWLVNYDFGAANEMIVYWIALGATVLIETLGNGSSVLLLSTYAIIAFLTLAGTALTPIIAGSNPVFLALFVGFFLAVGLPLLLDLAGFFLFGSFGILSVSLIVDLFYLIFTKPELAIETVEDVFTHGVASPVIQDFENTVEEYLGTGFVHLFGVNTLKNIMDNFWLHVSLQGAVVLPLTVVLSVLKMGLFVGGLVAGVYGFSELANGDEFFGGCLLLGGLLTSVYILIVDGTFGALLDMYVVSQVFPGVDHAVFLFTDVIAKSLLNSFFTLEADYWGIFYLIDLVQRFADGSFTPSTSGQSILDEYKIPENQAPLEPPSVSTPLSDVLTFLTPDHLENTDLEMVKYMTKPVVIGLLLPLVQGLTWAYQIPFFVDMRKHILGLSDIIE